MKNLLFAAVAGVAVLAASAQAEAAKWTIRTIDTNYTVCTGIEAPGAPKAFAACMLKLGISVPETAIVTTTTQVCKSTHTVQQTSPAQFTRWVYDTRFTYVNRPNCP